MNEERMLETIDAALDPREPAPDNAVAPELQQILCDLQSPDANTRARAVRTLCPCRGVQWGVPVFHHVRKMLHDPNPIVRRAVRHDLNENPWWSERQETRPDLGPRPRTVKVTLAIRRMAVGDLCDQLRAETGLPLVSSPGVARQRVTLFCKQAPLRDVLRQLSRLLDCPWGWVRNKGTYQYELRRDPGTPVSEQGRRRRAHGASKPGQHTNEAASRPDDTRATTRLAHDRALRKRITVQPAAGQEPPGAAAVAPFATPQIEAPTVTSAHVLEAIHHATGMPIVAEFCSRRYPIEAVSPCDQPLYTVLNQVAGAMGLCWQKEPDGWLQFRIVRTGL